jgi:hypothetical protein
VASFTDSTFDVTQDRPDRSGLRQNFYSRESVDYWDGEQPPEVPS